jgi:RHS repeat-associated protein
LATLSGGLPVPLSGVQAPSPSTFNYNYIPNSNLISTVTSPAHTVTNDYEPNRNILLTKSNTKASDNTVISSVNYIVNTFGQRTKRTTSDTATSVVTDWTYDALGQVETEDQPGTTTDRAYQYDHIGNRKKSANSLTLPTTDNYTSNALNQYSSLITNNSITMNPSYDADGNMTAGPHPADPSIPSLFFYDAENRLLEIRNATTGVTLQSNHYDAFHRLIRVTALHNGQSSTEHILWKGWTLVSRFVSSGGSLSETFHYTWGKDLSGSEQGAGGVGGLLAITRVPATGDASTRYPLYDGNGNITALVTANGSLSASYQYDAFGNSLSPTDHDASGWVNHNIHGFSTKPTFGHQGLHYYGYRWYNAPQGRWINRDPIEENGGLNLYGFVGNDEVNWFDYLGLATLTVSVDRYGRTKEAIYSVVTVSSDDADVNKCCCLPKFFHGIERGTDATENLLDEGTHNSAFDRENSPPFGPKNKTGGGLTSITGRVAKHGGRWPISIPENPPGMNQSDYDQAIDNEFRTGDGGDNIHAGPNQNHSSGCVLLGTCLSGNGGFDSYQGSLEADLDFKAAVACAKRKSKGISIKTKVSKLPSVTKGPITPKALPVSPCDQ